MRVEGWRGESEGGGERGESERERVEGDVLKYFQYKSRVPIQPSFH